MSGIKINEPYVKVEERIRDYPTLLNVDGTANLGGVIVAPTGPRLAYVSGPQDFLDKYTFDGSVPRNAHITFLNAYYMSFSTGLVIARSMNTTAVGGIYFTPDTTAYTNLFVNSSDESFWSILIEEAGSGTGYYYYCNGGDSDWRNFLTRAASITSLDSDGELIYPYSTLGKLIEDNSYIPVPVNNFDQVADHLTKSFTGQITSAYYNKNLGAITLYLTSGNNDKPFNIVTNNSINISYQYSDSVTDAVSLKGHTLNYKDGLPLTESIAYTVSGSGNIFESNFVIILGSMAYYHGAIDRSLYEDYSLIQVNSADEIATSLNGLSGVTCTIDEVTATGFNINIHCSAGNEIYAEGSLGCTIELDADYEDYESEANFKDYLFAIYPKDPQSNDAYIAVIDNINGDLFDLTLRDSGSSDTYTVSLNIDAVDKSGANVYIENLNSLGLNYTIDVNTDNISALTNSIASTGIYKFGNSGLDLSASSSNTCMVSALHALEDQEQYDIEYLSSFGYTNLNFIKTYVTVGRACDWFTPVDIPYDRTNHNSIKSYFLNIDNSSNVIAIGPFDKNTGLTGWMFYLAPSTLYYTKVFNNRAARKEFAPVFDITNGVLDYTNPCYLLGKSERVKLLNLKCPVNFAVYNQRSDVYYFNDNRTHQSVTNIVSEEQNRRMVNKIKKDCKRLLQSFKGRMNTSSTRSDVVSAIKYYFQTQLMSQDYRPNEYQIICDESNNNTPELINANKLAVTVRVRLDNAIKFIDVLVDVFPLGVDFES